jgi:hypothetical protein
MLEYVRCSRYLSFLSGGWETIYLKFKFSGFWLVEYHVFEVCEQYVRIFICRVYVRDVRKVYLRHFFMNEKLRTEYSNFEIKTIKT